MCTRHPLPRPIGNWAGVYTMPIGAMPSDERMMSVWRHDASAVFFFTWLASKELY